MRVLILSEGYDGTSGLHTYTRLLVDGLRARKHRVTLCTKRDGDGDVRILHPGMQYLSRPWAKWIDAWKLRRLVMRIKPDVIHVTFEPFARAAMLLPKQWAKRVVVTLHGSYAIWLFRQPGLVARAGRVDASFIAVSNYTKRRSIDEGGVAALEQRISVVYTGMNMPAMRKNTTGDVPHALLVGGVKSRKGVLEALEAVAIYKEKYGPIRFTIVGSCDESHPYVQETREKIEKMGLGNDVRLAGTLDDDALETTYGTTDLYLMPSQTTPDRFEGFGLVFLEAAARGIPCIGPDDGGSTEAIDEGVSGYRCPVQDAATIADRMHDLLVKKTISPTSCRAHAEKFSLENMIDGTEAVYRKIR